MNTLKFVIEPEHLTDFNIAFSRSLAKVNGLTGQLIWGLVVGLLVAVGGIVAMSVSNSELAMRAFLLGAWFFCLINYLTTIVLNRRASRLANDANGFVLGSRELWTDDDGLHIAGDVFRQDIRWRAIKSITAQHLVLVLWLGPAYGIFIPRSAFATQGDEAQFREMIMSKISSGCKTA